MSIFMYIIYDCIQGYFKKFEKLKSKLILVKKILKSMHFFFLIYYFHDLLETLSFPISPLALSLWGV